MRYREQYAWLLQPERRGHLLDAIRQRGYPEFFKAKSMRVVFDGPVPYVRFHVPKNNQFLARCDGIWLDLGDWAPSDWPNPFFFLALSVTDPEATQDLAHELLHLQDWMRLLEQDPSYPDRALRLAMRNLEDPALLPESVDFEVWKIFSLEPQAHRLDYRNGQHVIGLPHFLDIAYPYYCDTVEEYVELQMAGYVARLEESYLERFPEHGRAVRAALARAVDRHGRAIFGRSAFVKAERVWAGRFARIDKQRGRVGRRPGAAGQPV